jgi:hypothetical protein
MSKYFKENLLWNEFTKNTTGIPRPYVNPPESMLKNNRRVLFNNNFYLHTKIPIPFNSKPNLTERVLDLDIEKERHIVETGLCAYCGLPFNADDLAVIWKRYDTVPYMQPTGPRVFSDHFPFHEACMDEARIFCPFMRSMTQDEEFEKGPYSDLIIKAKAYKEVIETKVYPFIQRNKPE